MRPSSSPLLHGFAQLSAAVATATIRTLRETHRFETTDCCMLPRNALIVRVERETSRRSDRDGYRDCGTIPPALSPSDWQQGLRFTVAILRSTRFILLYIFVIILLRVWDKAFSLHPGHTAGALCVGFGRFSSFIFFPIHAGRFYNITITTTHMKYLVNCVQLF